MSLVQRDYILRLFEQMGQVIAVVIGLKKDGEPAQALQVMSDALKGLVGFDLEDIEKLSAADLVQMVRIARSGHSSPGEMVAGQLGAIGRLLDEAADTWEILGNPERADRARLKALHLYLVVLVEEGVDISDVHAAVSPMLERVSEFVLPYDISDMLWRYHESRGDFARAEDVLFEMLETGESDDGIRENAIAFYLRLLDLPDADLEHGGLPRNEVEASLHEVRQA